MLPALKMYKCLRTLQNIIDLAGMVRSQLCQTPQFCQSLFITDTLPHACYFTVQVFCDA